MVDDDKLNIKGMGDILSKLGVNVDSATNGQIAIDKVKLRKI